MKKAGSTVLLLAALLATILELHTACGQTTAKPTNTEKPGICPPQRYHEKDPFNDAYCDTDEDCTGNKKCCVDNFDKMCKPPAKDGAYKCPTTSYDETSPKRTDFCSSNSECAPNATCCMKNGGKTCHPSVGVKSGECPPDPIRCIRGIRPACLDDSTCQGNEKCCSSKCGMECLPPIKEHSDPKQEVAPNQEAVKPVCPPARQGFCPPDTTPPNVMTPCLVNCGNCKETEMCCSSGCMKVCKEMTKERPGYCPLNFLKCAIREILCKDDLGCSDTEKCCISKCKRQCVPLLTERPGYCPPNFLKCAIGEILCKDDLSCNDTQKCCDSECKRQCVPLRTDKPGVCPAPSTSCQKTNDTPDPNPVCTKDLHCTGDQKCCIVGCSQNCTEPTFV
ncbi:uncharacterized protein [Ambystoma mexicanum]|uniref:uncharacterized protein isoform X2 n=1 Tax=Ambystoma mexicanum TaxID=8296 RepID=UPI0037E8C25D